MSTARTRPSSGAPAATSAPPALPFLKNPRFLQKYDLSNRTAVVTGGGSGIGLSCAAALCSVGAHVIITGRDEQKLSTAVAQLRLQNGSAEHVPFDVSDPRAVRAAAAAVGETHARVHILVNNAGVAQPPEPLETLSDASFDRIMKTNLYGAFWVTQAFLPLMKACESGASIINIGSISGNVAAPAQQACYNATKAGLHHLSSSLAMELAGEGIRVNTVAPGFILTDMTRGRLDKQHTREWVDRIPMKRVADPDEVAQVVLHLACDASSYVTGMVWTVDGGFCVP